MFQPTTIVKFTALYFSVDPAFLHTASRQKYFCHGKVSLFISLIRFNFFMFNVQIGTSFRLMFMVSRDYTLGFLKHTQLISYSPCICRLRAFLANIRKHILGGKLDSVNFITSRAVHLTTVEKSIEYRDQLLKYPQTRSNSTDKQRISK